MPAYPSPFHFGVRIPASSFSHIPQSAHPGITGTGIELWGYFDEYQALTAEEKQELVERFRDERSTNMVLRRDTPRGRIQDVANVMRNIQMLVSDCLHTLIAFGSDPVRHS